VINLKDFKATFSARIGLNLTALFAEFDRLFAKTGLDPNEPLTDAYIKQAKAIYAAYIANQEAAIVDLGFNELVNLWNTKRVPKRKRRVGASGA
jgi:hypothetical protein